MNIADYLNHCIEHFEKHVKETSDWKDKSHHNYNVGRLVLAKRILQKIESGEITLD